MFLDLRMNPIDGINDKIIISYEDFFNRNSVVLAEDFNIDLMDIIGNFNEFSKEKQFLNFRTLVDPEIDPLNFYTILSKKFASLAIVHYELVNREEIYLPSDEGLFLVKDKFGPEFQIRSARRDDFTAYEMRKRNLDYLKGGS